MKSMVLVIFLLIVGVFAEQNVLSQTIGAYAQLPEREVEYYIEIDVANKNLDRALKVLESLDSKNEKSLHILASAYLQIVSTSVSLASHIEDLPEFVLLDMKKLKQIAWSLYVSDFEYFEVKAKLELIAQHLSSLRPDDIHDYYMADLNIQSQKRDIYRLLECGSLYLNQIRDFSLDKYWGIEDEYKTPFDKEKIIIHLSTVESLVDIISLDYLSFYDLTSSITKNLQKIASDYRDNKKDKQSTFIRILNISSYLDSVKRFFL